MEKDVIVSVLGIQNDMTSTEKEKIEMITTGKYYKKNEKKYITYKETELSGEKDTLSTIKIEKDKVTLTRIGESNTQMIFEIGKKHITHYVTPFGFFDLGIITRNIKIDLDKEDGEIKITYLLEVDNNPIGVNDIYIKIQSNKKEFKLFD